MNRYSRHARELRSCLLWIVWLAFLATVTTGRAATPAAERAAQTGSGIGQEIKALEKGTSTPSIPSRPAKPAIKIEDVKADTNKVEAAAAEAPKKDGFKFTTLEVRGDQEFLKKAGLLAEFRAQVEKQTLTAAEVQGMVRQWNKTLVSRGYYAASIVTVPGVDYSKGVLVVAADQGRIGKKTFYSAGGTVISNGVKTVKRVPFKGRYYSQKQLERRLASLAEGEAFEYQTFYSAVYNVNATPDITMDTDLTVRKETTAGLSRRFVDMAFTVDDNMPLHASLSVGNSGTKATGDWRPSATIQHLNLTKHDDVLSLNLGPISENVKDMKSFGASYYLPNNWRNGGASTLYGGYSDLDAKDVVEGIDVRGQGWFAGLQQSYRAITTAKHLLNVSLGLTYRKMEDQLILTDEGEEDWELDPREVTMVPMSLALSYSSTEPDFIGGRNFLTSQTIAHRAGFLGASSEEEIQTLRVNADGDFYVERLQAARVQPLQGEQRGSLGWLLFIKLDGQLASGPLVPAEQKALGGMDSVRGFPERIVQGDDGVSGTLELRTPLMSTFLGSPYKKKEDRDRALNEGKTTDRLQFVVFTDAGMVKIKDSLGPVDQYTIWSAGAGMRLSLTKYSQLRFDWGVPLSGREEAATSQEDVKASGRYHLSAQLQF